MTHDFVCPLLQRQLFGTLNFPRLEYERCLADEVHGARAFGVVPAVVEAGGGVGALPPGAVGVLVVGEEALVAHELPRTAPHPLLLLPVVDPSQPPIKTSCRKKDKFNFF